MVGSSDSVASSNIVLNTIVAESFKEAADILEKVSDFDEAVHDMIKDLLTEHRRIVFNGNGYSQAWVEEAARRGLPNIATTVDAISALTTDKAVKLFEEFKVFTKTELESREEIEYENYAKLINIEAKTMIGMANKFIIPSVIKYVGNIANSLSTVTNACPEADISVQKELLLECSDLLSEVKIAVSNLSELTEKIAHISSAYERAKGCSEALTKAMLDLRKPVDRLEGIVDKELWPMPSYGDLMFEV